MPPKLSDFVSTGTATRLLKVLLMCILEIINASSIKYPM
jgi:hypothetical protein